MQTFSKFFSFFILLFSFSACVFSAAQKNDEANVQSAKQTSPSISSALSFAQQAGPFYSFGQNILNKNQKQLNFSPSYSWNNNGQTLGTSPGFLYGLTDRLSFLLSLPITVFAETRLQHSSGLSGPSVELEYAFYSHSTPQRSEQATLVAGLSLPAGAAKTRSLSFNSPTYFMGSTYNRIFSDWFWFTSPGILFISAQNGMQLGSQYLYQFGIGHNLYQAPEKYIFSGLLEFDGQYTGKAKSHGHTIQSSGGNIAYITPSLSLATAQITVQLGFSFATCLSGGSIETNPAYIAAVSITWTLN